MRQPFLLITGVLSTLLTPACGESPAVANGKGTGCVWRVESATTRVYLCGTIHLLRKADYPLPAPYEVAYQDSKRLVFELPPGSSSDPKLANTMREQGSFPAGTTLQSTTKPETWKAFTDWCSKRHVSADSLNPYKPWFVALTVAATEYAAQGAEPDRGVDTTFEARMAKDGKSGEGLETVDMQIGLFAKLSEKQQAELLEQTLAEVKELPDQFQEMITMWRTGDVEGLNKMMFEEAKNYPDLMEIFLTDRNASWISRLEGYLGKTEPVMVLVGAGHLGGPTGVISLLKAKGYKVEQVKGAAVP